jgi:hypothetical protein
MEISSGFWCTLPLRKIRISQPVEKTVCVRERASQNRW